jgi:hypothetical protein
MIGDLHPTREVQADREDEEEFDIESDDSCSNSDEDMEIFT